MPPTELFNEGWLLRLALDWFSKHPEVQSPLRVPTGSHWYSEALLPTQFGSRKGGIALGESHTHADGAIGRFTIGGTGAGDLVLAGNATHFVIVEAKLNSKLSAGVTNAPNFDQAARNVACMARVMCEADVRPEQISRLGFVVVAPASQIDRGYFASELTKESLQAKVASRAAAYEEAAQTTWVEEWFLPVLDAMEVDAVSWETVLATIEAHDDSADHWFAEFYDCCLHYSRLPGRTTS